MSSPRVGGREGGRQEGRMGFRSHGRGDARKGDDFSFRGVQDAAFG